MSVKQIYPYGSLMSLFVHAGNVITREVLAKCTRNPVHKREYQNLRNRLPSLKRNVKKPHYFQQTLEEAVSLLQKAMCAETIIRYW